MPDENVIENSVFGVWKEPGMSQRLIWGGTRSNLIFNPGASYTELPTPDLLTELQLPPDKELFLASCDNSQYYNRLRAPDFLVPFLGFPRIRATLVDTELGSTFVVPCLRCIPMGATFAVSLAQAASMALVRSSAGSSHALTLESNHTLKHANSIHVVYIDDISTIGTCRAQVNRDCAEVVRTLTAAHLPEAKSKRQSASRHRPSVALGLWWWKDGFLTVQPSLVSKLWRERQAILERGGASTHEMRSLLGKWTWACLLRRCLLSVFSEVYKLCSLPREFRRRPLLPAQVIELETILDLLPLMYANFRSSDSARIYASDACPSGGAVTYCDLADRHKEKFMRIARETKIRKGWYSALHGETVINPNLSAPDHQAAKHPLTVSNCFRDTMTRQSFKTAIQTSWLFRAHNNVLEMEAALLAIRHMGRSPSSAGKRVTIFIDNSSVLGALRKGRSSSYQLNKVCRRIAAALVSADVRLSLHWIPSHLNPADAPSRVHGNANRISSLGVLPPRIVKSQHRTGLH